MELLKTMRNVNYEKKIASLEEKIQKKAGELKALKAEKNKLESEFEQKKNKELLELLTEKNISSSKAVEIISKAIENEDKK